MKDSLLEVIKNKIHPKLRLNAVCPYFTMFPLAFPYKVLRSAKASDAVYDPFCGRGTTNYAARLLGLVSFGVDSNPVAYAIAQAKLVQGNPEEISARCLSILDAQGPSEVPQSEFWKMAYHSDTLQQICSIRQYFLTKPRLDRIDIALRALLLGILHGPRKKEGSSYLSNQMPRTFSSKPNYSIHYWKQHSLRPIYRDVAELINQKACYTFNKETPKTVRGKIILGDSRSINGFTDKRFDWVVTSPPYFGMVTYEQDQWLRNWFLGGPEKVDYQTKNQISHGSETGFVRDLSKVWTNTATLCRPGAALIIRFGALPSQSEKPPTMLIKESLRWADCGWRIRTIRTAGRPAEGRRQANQFTDKRAHYIEEVDVYAVLKP